ncbi:Hypothetical predicted protein [Marmota monax]|uniref:Uncharacterized protein n=1 Tax=Marmota monax TaxID=9995 RepID=A0A5E4A602_MARMO|nr:Hypothetical predicted protein [Marmota monax]
MRSCLERPGCPHTPLLGPWGFPEPRPAASPWLHAGIQGLGLPAAVTALPLPGPDSSAPVPGLGKCTGCPACCPGGLLLPGPPEGQLSSLKPGDGLRGCPRMELQAQGWRVPSGVPPPPPPSPSYQRRERDWPRSERRLAWLWPLPVVCCPIGLFSEQKPWETCSGATNEPSGLDACLGLVPWLGPGSACSTFAPKTPGRSEPLGCCERPAPRPAPRPGPGHHVCTGPASSATGPG